jgi:hypothetical protein
MLNHTKTKKFREIPAKRITAVLLILSSFALSACLGIRTHVKGIEPSARPLSTGKYEIIEPAEFTISSFKLFWILPVTPDLKIHEIIEETVNNKGGDNLIEMQLWHERQYWILGTIDMIHVKGKIIRTAD